MGIVHAAHSGVFPAELVRMRFSSEPPVRIGLTTYALRVRCSTPELRWLAVISALTSLFARHQFTKYS